MAVQLETPSPYPINVDVLYAEPLSRWKIFVKWLLAMPHYVVLYFLGIGLSVVTVIAFFSILFTREYPTGLLKFAVGVRRWQINVNAYTSLLRDEYPPFSWDAGIYPATLAVDDPGKLNRWLPLVKWLLAIPHLIIVTALGVAVFVTTVVAFFAILFTGRYPRSLFDFAVGVMRWSERVTLYITLMTDVYPPFRFAA
jgi:hypothetical protein